MRALCGLTLALGLSALAPACKGDGPGLADSFRLRVASPNGVEGAALIRLIGAVEAVEADAPGWLLTDARADTTWVFRGVVTPGDVEFRVRRPAGAGELAMELLEVSGPDDQARDITDYRLVVQ